MTNSFLHCKGGVLMDEDIHIRNLLLALLDHGLRNDLDGVRSLSRQRHRMQAAFVKLADWRIGK